MELSEEEVAQQYPIHWLVWNNRFEDLKDALDANKYTPEDIEAKDPRGRTPLLLAVTLNHIESVKVLIEAGADVNCEKDGWTAVQEATATGDMDLLSYVLSHRDYQRHVVRSSGIPELLNKLSLAPDFYVEMKWEFTSWVPLVSRMCPFDTYKVYKRGGNVRVDTTLVGFHQNKWQRGDKTYIFTGQGKQATLMELDHERGTFWSEAVSATGAPTAPPRAALAARLAAPIAINYLDTDKISFERNKCGIWGWRQDKTETVQGYECKVFSANNVELVSKTRSEHLPKGERRSQPKAPLAGLLALAETDRSEGSSPLLTPDKESPPPSPRSGRASPRAPPPLSWREYFSTAPLDQDVGRPQEVATKVQKFKANLWLCEDYPLELQEQIMPILDLMTAISSPHFAKLKDFIQMQLPAGFPVKIEIPLFHVLNARITFGNIFATETPVPHIECIQEGDRLSCVVDDACFTIGGGYVDGARTDIQDDEEGLLQYAIQQSLMQPGTSDDRVDVWEALRGARPSTPGSVRDENILSTEDTQLQRAIEESLASISVSDFANLPDPGRRTPDPGRRTPDPARRTPDSLAELDGADPELAEALALSVQEQLARDRIMMDEERALDEVLRLSLIDK